MNRSSTCLDCPFAVFGMSFGGRGKTISSWECKIARATFISRNSPVIFEINADEAKLMDIEPLLAEMGVEPSSYPGFHATLYRHLPSPFNPAYWRDEEWNPEYHVARWILGQQECFITQEQVEEFVEAYTEYRDDAKKKVRVASEELVEMKRWLQLAENRKEL